MSSSVAVCRSCDSLRATPNSTPCVNTLWPLSTVRAVRRERHRAVLPGSSRQLPGTLTRNRLPRCRCGSSTPALDAAGRRAAGRCPTCRPDVRVGIACACSVVGAGGSCCRCACTCSKPRVSRIGFVDAQRLRFLRDVLDAVARVRVIAQPLRSARPALLLDRLEHVRHVARIVAGARHDLRAFEVGLPFVLAAEAQERGAEAELRALRDRPGPSRRR